MFQLLLESDLNNIALLTMDGCCDYQAGDYLSKPSPQGWGVIPIPSVSLSEEVKSLLPVSSSWCPCDGGCAHTSESTRDYTVGSARLIAFPTDHC